MRLRPIKFILFLCAAAVAMAAAFATRTNYWFAAGFGLLALLMIKCATASLRDDGGSALNDPAVSTLVFPPESRFEQSVRPKR